VLIGIAAWAYLADNRGQHSPTRGSIEQVLLHCIGHKAAEALTTQCPELAEEADISPKKAASRFDPQPT
jgi:hypothetical protein